MNIVDDWNHDWFHKDFAKPKSINMQIPQIPWYALEQIPEKYPLWRNVLKSESSFIKSIEYITYALIWKSSSWNM